MMTDEDRATMIVSSFSPEELPYFVRNRIAPLIQLEFRHVRADALQSHQKTLPRVFHIEGRYIRVMPIAPLFGSRQAQIQTDDLKGFTGQTRNTLLAADALLESGDSAGAFQLLETLVKNEKAPTRADLLTAALEQTPVEEARMAATLTVILTKLEQLHE